MKDLWKEPFLGCAYYPEDWDKSDQAYDIEMMKKAGIKCVRIAEFAWHDMEPSPGDYRFDWLHRVIDRLADNGISVMLGTPSATPPAWFLKRYPDAAAEDKSGRRKSHGGRRHCCSNNPDYVRLSLKIAEKMAEEFGNDENVVAWQIDNEIYSHGDGCFCPYCVAKFRKYLEKKYKTVENLNEKWNLHLFSQAYDSFDDVPAPRDAWHNPHLIMNWRIFQNDCHADFVIAQADILHKYTKAPVGTDIMPLNGMDYKRLNEHLDVVEFNHYQSVADYKIAVTWFDYCRTMIKQKPFVVTETQSSWNGSTEIKMSVPDDGFIRMNSVLPVMLGGIGNMYWLWRTHWAGHELQHGAVLDTCGKPFLTFGEIAESAEILNKAKEIITRTEVSTDVGMLSSPLDWNMLGAQTISTGADVKKFYDFHAAINDSGLRPDVLNVASPLDKYRLLFAPLLLCAEEYDLPKRLSNWVRDGGTLVAGPFTDVRNTDGARYRDRRFGFLGELTGAEWLYGVPDHENKISAVWNESGEAFEGGIFYDVFDSEKDGSTPLVSVVRGHSALVGKAIAAEYRVGKGTVILLGTFPSDNGMKKLAAHAAARAEVRRFDFDGKLVCAERKGDGIDAVAVTEYGGLSAVYRFDGQKTDLLSGRIFENSVEIKPFETLLLK